jgi:large subunit ribosomal protein L17
MRHQVSGKRLGRGSNQRKALMKGLAIALLREERIETTEVKAKELRKFVEPFITMSKVDSIANRRLAMARLGSKETVQKIFGADFRKRFETRPGGYTRILKMAPRHGDGAEMALIELVDYQLPAEAGE